MSKVIETLTSPQAKALGKDIIKGMTGAVLFIIGAFIASILLIGLFLLNNDVLNNVLLSVVVASGVGVFSFGLFHAIRDSIQDGKKQHDVA